MTLDEQVSFILRFSQLDVLSLRPYELIQLRGQFAGFFGRRGEDMTPGVRAFGFMAIPLEQPLPQEFTKEQFTSLQKETLRLLREGGGRVPISTEVLTISLPLQGGIPRFTQMIGATRDMFLLTCALLLVRPEIASRLRRCPAPHARPPGQQCNKLFLRIKKQQYCSKTCANRVSKQKERGGT
jgi:hypothetical protein